MKKRLFFSVIICGLTLMFVTPKSAYAQLQNSVSASREAIGNQGAIYLQFDANNQTHTHGFMNYPDSWNFTNISGTIDGYNFSCFNSTLGTYTSFLVSRNDLLTAFGAYVVYLYVDYANSATTKLYVRLGGFSTSGFFHDELYFYFTVVYF